MLYIANRAHGEMQIELCCKTQAKKIEKSADKQLLTNCYVAKLQRAGVPC